MSKLVRLAKDTAIYGVSSIAGKVLNWLLVPLYAYVLTNTADYGIVTNLYGWTALLLVVLTYGMETGFFRFANKQENKAEEVYGTILSSVGSTSLVFAIITVIFAAPFANMLGYHKHPEFIAMLGVVVAMDAFSAIPFAYLRYKNRPYMFAGLKMVMIFVNIFFNLFFLIACPWLQHHHPGSISWFYRSDYGVGYIFVANLISTVVALLCLLPFVIHIKFRLNWPLLKQILSYSFPLLLLGIAGIMNQTIDKILFPVIYPNHVEGMKLLGIYGACSKVAMVMMMFTQAFRFAYEPFVFAQHKDSNSKAAYSDAMKYFIIFALMLVLSMTFYLDVLKYIIGPEYRQGLAVVPIVLGSYLFQGIFFNLSLWYKLIDKTIWGAIFSGIGFIITLSLNILLVPSMYYFGSAWAAFSAYFVIAILSYFYGQKYFPIDYQLKVIGKYFLLAAVLFVLGWFVKFHFIIITLAFRTVLLAIFVRYAVKHDFPLNKMPYINKFFK
ncbi:lipopolysaccharide biosynthesis protein [Microbacter margulisiae]|uniref:O-antigen/teichoic acid export membrane protein n=1 Tax=Microbacter margulisiae TaxID=1350067 RepID=A0A7W5DRD3_9PORP|nr:oligosaccharide flippase family protein [Microbacter margulisiae]MBB3187335.1 O-antigen/teichoic acid export membrane protein [Microbacter margulisiae]